MFADKQRGLGRDVEIKCNSVQQTVKQQEKPKTDNGNKEEEKKKRRGRDGERERGETKRERERQETCGQEARPLPTGTLSSGCTGGRRNLTAGGAVPCVCVLVQARRARV